MTLVTGIGRDQLMQDMLNCSMKALAGEEGHNNSLIFCNLPPRRSVSENLEPSRMSYYDGNEHLSVPFKWEAAPGTPIRPSEANQQHSSRLQLRPPPSASNSPLNPFAPPSYKDQQKSGLPPKIRNHSRPEFTHSMSSMSSGSATMTGDSSFSHQGGRSKGSMSRRSEFDWPEVSDDETDSFPRGASDHDHEGPPASTAPTTSGKQWSFSSSSFSSASMSSQTPSPVSGPVSSGDRVPRGGSGSAHDLVALRNLVNFAATSAASPANCYVAGGGRSATGSTQGSDDGESDDTDDHVSPGGFWSCMPIFSKVRMIQSAFSTSEKQMPAALNFSRRLTPGSKNRGYRPSYRQSL